jgi:hypothetical protein
MTSFDSDDDNIVSSRSNVEFKSLSEELQVKNKERRERMEQLKAPGLLRELINEVKQKRSGTSGSS